MLQYTNKELKVDYDKTFKENLEILSKELRDTMSKREEHTFGDENYHLYDVIKNFFDCSVDFEYESVKYFYIEICGSSIKLIATRSKSTKSHGRYSNDMFYTKIKLDNTLLCDITINDYINDRSTTAERNRIKKIYNDKILLQRLANKLDDYDIPYGMFKMLTEEFSFGKLKRLDIEAVVSVFPEEGI